MLSPPAFAVGSNFRAAVAGGWGDGRRMKEMVATARS